MENRIFQNAILELKKNIHRTIGVIDENGYIIACSERSMIGIALAGAFDVLSASEGIVCHLNGIAFMLLEPSTELSEYAVFTMGEDEVANSICALSSLLLNKSIHKNRFDNTSFVKEILLGNLLPGDIDLLAEDRNFVVAMPRAILLIRHQEIPISKVLSEMFLKQKHFYIIPISDTETALVTPVQKITTLSDLYETAKNIESTTLQKHDSPILIGISTIVSCAQELPHAFQEVKIAIDVGKVFNESNSIFRYDRLGIGRLIYYLPTSMCETYLREALNRQSLDLMNQDMVNTAKVLLDTNLNLQDTSRKLFIHYNTLSYRIERIKQMTGLDLREFDDAATFKIALLVDTCLKYRKKHGEPLQLLPPFQFTN